MQSHWRRTLREEIRVARHCEKRKRRSNLLTNYYDNFQFIRLLVIASESEAIQMFTLFPCVIVWIATVAYAPSQ